MKVLLAGSSVKHTGVQAVANYLGSSFIVGSLTFSFQYMDLTMQNLYNRYKYIMRSMRSRWITITQKNL